MASHQKHHSCPHHYPSNNTAATTSKNGQQQPSKHHLSIATVPSAKSSTLRYGGEKIPLHPSSNSVSTPSPLPPPRPQSTLLYLRPHPSISGINRGQSIWRHIIFRNSPRPRTICPIRSSSNIGSFILSPPPPRPKSTPPSFPTASLQTRNQLRAINSIRLGKILFTRICHGQEQSPHPLLIQYIDSPFSPPPPPRPQSMPPSLQTANLQPTNQLGTINSRWHGYILFSSTRHGLGYSSNSNHQPIIQQIKSNTNNNFGNTE
mmetsp:Transcript_23212/g.41603  ORF Transcript_23212/g.41603 Transcript_23212/m.41603 type:complete len:262 (-) Transcript_23212:345-1130(-)